MKRFTTQIFPASANAALMLIIDTPTRNQLVELNTPFGVSGFATPNNIKEVTIQVDNGPITEAYITIVPMPRGLPSSTLHRIG